MQVLQGFQLGDDVLDLGKSVTRPFTTLRASNDSCPVGSGRQLTSASSFANATFIASLACISSPLDPLSSLFTSIALPFPLLSPPPFTRARLGPGVYGTSSSSLSTMIGSCFTIVPLPVQAGSFHPGWLCWVAQTWPAVRDMGAWRSERREVFRFAPLSEREI